MKLSHIAVGAASVMAQAVLPSAAFSLPKSAIVAAVATAQAQEVLSTSVVGPYQGKLYPDDPSAGHGFGGAYATIAVHGRTAAVGASQDDDDATDSGAVYIFAYNGTDWVQHQKLKAEDPSPNAKLGMSVDMHEDDLLIAGAFQEECWEGSAYIFAKNDQGVWQQQAKLVPPNGGPILYFGHTVAISGDTAMVGAHNHDSPENSGAAFVYVNDGTGNWQLTQTLKPEVPRQGENFAHSLALSGTKAIFSSHMCRNDAGVKTGCAYFFEYNGSSWLERQKIFALDGAAEDLFGLVVKMDGDKFITGARHDDDNCDQLVEDCKSGSAYIFHYSGTEWVEEDKLTPSHDATALGELFGETVNIYGDKAVVRLTNSDHCGTDASPATQCGTVYVFQNDGSGNWEQRETLIAPDASDKDYWGASVAIFEDTLFVSTTHDDDHNLQQSGSVYVWGTGGGASSSGGDADSAGPWEIQHISLSTDFGNSSANEISSDFFIGKDRESEVLLLDKDCMSNITDIVINTTKVVENQNSTHDLLSVGLSVDKSAIGNSSIYNKTTNEIKLCQVTRLVLPGSKSGGNGALTIAEHLLQIAVAFDLSANFNFTAGLEAGKILNETDEVNAAAAVDAFKCDNSFNPNDDALGPNDEMFTCVRSKDAAFQVQEVERMTISQIGKQQDLEVIAGGVVQIPSISTRDYTAEGAIVGSRIPINLFDFEDGAFLKISGAVTMKLADGTSRRLNVELGSTIRDLQEETEEASYTVDVALQAAEESAIDLSNSAAGVAAAALGGFAIATSFLLL